MVLPLHIFEPRYLEMITLCVEQKTPFGVVLIREGEEVGAPARPYSVGTAARVTKVDELENGRLNILTVGAKRFRIVELDDSHSYLSAKVRAYPILNGSTQLAVEMARKVRPRIIEYVELLSKATQQQLKLDRLPEDPTMLAQLVAISLQVNSDERQHLLERVGIPEMLAYEAHLLDRECLLTRHMVDTQSAIERMNAGTSGYLFPN
jgi:hypothetical protein